ncbi:sensor histidine kinase [Ruminococcaceae bacterium OttesenSCG-928-A11]|nr:sensor histidine kinase [Ruminococcaceae bacterium OttesenSCG-928-A11]
MIPRRLLRSFRFRLIAATLLFMASAITLSSLLNTRYFVDNLQQQNEQAAADSFGVVEGQLEEMLYDAQTAAYRIAEIDDVYDYLVGPPARGAAATQAQRAFARAVDEAILRYTFLDSVIFMRADGTIAGTSARWRYFYGGLAHPFFRTEAYREVADSNDYVWIGYYPRSYFNAGAPGNGPRGDSHLVWGARNIRYTFGDGREPLSILALFAVSEDALLERIAYAGGAGSRLYLLDRTGRKLAGDAGLESGGIPDYFDDLTRQAFSSITHTDAEGERHQVVYRHLDRTGWTLVRLTPLSVFSESVRPFWVFTLLVGTATLLVVFLLYTLWLRWVTRPLLEMSDALRKVAENDRSVRIGITGRESEEIAVMKEQFNRMLDSIEMLLRQKEADEEDKLRLEIQSLQTQIAPHFIYNSIASIRWMATLSGAHQVADMLVTLVNLLRPVFRSWTTQWTVQEELFYIENYIKMMRLRFGNRITFAIDNRLPGADILLPRFILQPLLENCFAHGMAGEAPLSIEVVLEAAGSDVVIRVRDDGAGIPPEQLARMRRLLQGPPPPPEQAGEGIGLANVNRRVKLFSGEGYGLALDSRVGHGTSVTVRLRKLTSIDKEDLS